MTIDHKIFELGDIDLLMGGRIPNAFLAYQTYGQLNASGNNVVVLPTFYTGTHKRNEGFFGSGRAVDPDKHFIVSINMFGNGLSSSPSNTPAPLDGPRFPDVTLWDNVACQFRLLTEALGVTQVALVTGWSMAGCQSYQWAAQYPNFVKAILPFCASAKTSSHNFVFLEGVKAALCADASWNDGNYNSPPRKGLKAFGRVYAGWAFSQTFYRNEMYKNIGYESPHELLDDWAEDHANNWDANDLLCKLKTWQLGDISVGEKYDGNFKKALNNIKAKTILLPCSDDLYFPPEDNLFEVQNIQNAEVTYF